MYISFVFACQNHQNPFLMLSSMIFSTLNTKTRMINKYLLKVEQLLMVCDYYYYINFIKYIVITSFNAQHQAKPVSNDPLPINPWIHLLIPHSIKNKLKS
jgi:hypothetical protein